MKFSFGNYFKISIEGASHADKITGSIFNIDKDIKLDLDLIYRFIDKRRPKKEISTDRIEDDIIHFVSGINENFITNGDPLVFYFENKNIDNSKYIKGVCRPGHADLVGYLKYNDEYDYLGGGFFSGRMMAPIVVIGAIAKQIIQKKYKIEIRTHIKEILNIKDEQITRNNAFSFDNKEIPLINNDALISIKELIKKCKDNNDSLGGMMESIIMNVPSNLGEPLFNSLEGRLSSYLFAIPSLKGINFGDGIDYIYQKGSQVIDEMEYDKNKNITFLANHNGGINGGISNGNDIIFSTIFKPISSINQNMRTINYETKENINIKIEGRHDPCILPRVGIIIDSMCYICLAELLKENHEL